MSSFLSYATEFLPILLGVGAMLLLKRTRLVRGKITIKIDPVLQQGQESSSGFVGDAERGVQRRLLLRLPVRSSEVATGLKPLGTWRGYVWSFEDMRRYVFRRLAYDSLIALGLKPKGAAEVDSLALEKMGLLDLRTGLDFIRNLGRHKREELSIFATDKAEFLKRVLSGGAESGVLLAFMINGDLNVYSQYLP